MKKKYIFATSAALVVLIAGAFYTVYAQKNNGIAAVVNGEEITVAEVKNAYEQNPQIKSQVSFEEFYARALDNIINAKLALQAATSANIQATPEYQQQLASLQDDLASQVYINKKVSEKVTEEDIKKVYDEYLANFKAEKEIKAQHILVDDEATAKDIIAKLDKKESTFAELALKFSKDQPDLGYFTAEMMVPEFSDAAFAMEKNSYSKEPVKTEFGYHVIFVEDIRDTKPLPLEKVQDQIKNNLYQQAFVEIVKDMVKEADIEKYDLNGKKIKAVEPQE
jgi:peptidyl-prolyl cis-trans isomerase C